MSNLGSSSYQPDLSEVDYRLWESQHYPSSAATPRTQDYPSSAATPGNINNQLSRSQEPFVFNPALDEYISKWQGTDKHPTTETQQSFTTYPSTDEEFLGWKRIDNSSTDQTPQSFASNPSPDASSSNWPQLDNPTITQTRHPSDLNPSPDGHVSSGFKHSPSPAHHDLVQGSPAAIEQPQQPSSLDQPADEDSLNRFDRSPSATHHRFAQGDKTPSNRQTSVTGPIRSAPVTRHRFAPYGDTGLASYTSVMGANKSRLASSRRFALEDDASHNRQMSPMRSSQTANPLNTIASNAIGNEPRAARPPDPDITKLSSNYSITVPGRLGRHNSTFKPFSVHIIYMLTHHITDRFGRHLNDDAVHRVLEWAYKARLPTAAVVEVLRLPTYVQTEAVKQSISQNPQFWHECTMDILLSYLIWAKKMVERPEIRDLVAGVPHPGNPSRTLESDESPSAIISSEKSVGSPQRPKSLVVKLKYGKATTLPQAPDLQAEKPLQSQDEARLGTDEHSNMSASPQDPLDQPKVPRRHKPKVRLEDLGSQHNTDDQVTVEASPQRPSHESEGRQSPSEEERESCAQSFM